MLLRWSVSSNISHLMRYSLKTIWKVQNVCKINRHSISLRSLMHRGRCPLGQVISSHTDTHTHSLHTHTPPVCHQSCCSWEQKVGSTLQRTAFNRAASAQQHRKINVLVDYNATDNRRTYGTLHSLCRSPIYIPRSADIDSLSRPDA